MGRHDANNSHPEKALTAVKAKTVTIAGRYADGNGLYLVVDPSGAKRWVLRIVVQGRRRDIGLGSFKLVSLAEAREKALAFRKIARDGGDPLTEARKAPPCRRLPKPLMPFMPNTLSLGAIRSILISGSIRYGPMHSGHRKSSGGSN